MRIALAIFLGLAVFAPAAAQQPPQPPVPEEFRVRVKVELVRVPLVVRDLSGEFVYDLSRRDVLLLDNGVPQQLTSFDLAAEPLSLVILLDTSQRIAPLLDRVRQSGILFTNYILGTSGEAAVLTFDTSVTLRQEFTSDADKIIGAIQKIPAGGSESRLADGLDQAVTLLRERPEGRRRVIIVVTEPRNQGSATPIGVPLRLAQLSDISIYTVALNPLEADLRRRPEDTPVPRSPYPPGVFPAPGIPGSPQTPTTEAQQRYARADLLSAIMILVRTLHDTAGQDVLELYAQGTGGLNYSPFGRSALETALNQIGQDLHNQYLLTYRPSNLDEQGFHRIEVRVARPNVSVRSRPGYYVGLPPG